MTPEAERERAQGAAVLPPEALPEVYDPPAFLPGQKVRALVAVRNDGTMPGSDRGTFLVEAGDAGYVTGIGEFLQRYYIYAVDFVERGRLVGMRRHEIAAMDEETAAPDQTAPPGSATGTATATKGETE